MTKGGGEQQRASLSGEPPHLRLVGEAPRVVGTTVAPHGTPAARTKALKPPWTAATSASAVSDDGMSAVHCALRCPELHEIGAPGDPTDCRRVRTAAFICTVTVARLSTGQPACEVYTLITTA